MVAAAEDDFYENNTQLAKALVEQRKDIAYLQLQLKNRNKEWFKLYEENIGLKNQINDMKKEIIELFKLNTHHYADFIKKHSIMSALSQESRKDVMNEQRMIQTPNSSFGQKSSVKYTDGANIIVDVHQMSTVSEKSWIDSEESVVSVASERNSNKTITSTDLSDPPINQSEWVNKENIDTVTASTSTSAIIENNHQPHEIKQQVFSDSDNDDEDEEHEHSIINLLDTSNKIIRSPVGKRIQYDEEANMSLQELKKRKSVEKLTFVAEDPTIPKNLSNETQDVTFKPIRKTFSVNTVESNPMSAKLGRRSVMPANELAISDRRSISHTVSSVSNVRENQQLLNEKTGQNTVNLQIPLIVLVKPQEDSNENEGMSNMKRQKSSRERNSIYLSKSITKTPSFDKRKTDYHLSPYTILKSQQTSNYSYTQNRKTSNEPLDLSHGNTDLNVASNNSKRNGEPMLKNSPNTISANEKNRSRGKVPDLLKVSVKSGTKERTENKENVSVLFPHASMNKTLHSSTLVDRSPLRRLTSPNLSPVLLSKSREIDRAETVARNIDFGSNSPNVKKIHKSLTTTEKQPDVKRQTRKRSKSVEDINSQTEDHLNVSERPRRHVPITSYAEPKLNTKMRRNF